MTAKERRRLVREIQAVAQRERLLIWSQSFAQYGPYQPAWVPANQTTLERRLARVNDEERSAINALFKAMNRHGK